MNGHRRTWRLSFKPDARDIAVFLIFSTLMVLRVHMPIEATSGFSYRHPWLAMITLFPVLTWLTGSYILGAIGFVILMARSVWLVLHGYHAKAAAKEDRVHPSELTERK
jgi:hypothetical protein